MGNTFSFLHYFNKSKPPKNIFGKKKQRASSNFPLMVVSPLCDEHPIPIYNFENSVIQELPSQGTVSYNYDPPHLINYSSTNRHYEQEEEPVKPVEPVEPVPRTESFA